MPTPKSCLSIVVGALIATLFLAPTLSHADTYSIVSLATDNRQFYGMDDAGHTVLYGSFFSCGDPSTGCYETYLNGAFTGHSSTAPLLNWDFVQGTCISLPCSISKNGRSATISSDPVALQDLFASSGSGPQFLLKTGFGPIYAIDGLGDIVFDNGSLNEWYEAFDLTTAATPEPGSLLLLATGLLAIGIPVLRRRTIPKVSF